MTSWDLGQQEEDLENSKFRKRAFHESIYSSSGLSVKTLQTKVPFQLPVCFLQELTILLQPSINLDTIF